MIPKISLAIPYHQTTKTAFFLSRLLKSIDEQTFKEYEVVLTNEEGMAHNHNAAILKSKGEIIKMIQMDDYFAYPDALKDTVKAFELNDDKKWLISPSLHVQEERVGGLHEPEWTMDIYTGNNKLGSISTLAFRKKNQLLFEEPLTWCVDVELYYRMYLLYGMPMILNKPTVVIDIRNDRLTNSLSEELKANEVEYLKKKYGK